MFVFGPTSPPVSIGEVMTMSMSDFDRDRLKDIVVGTRTSSTQGKLIIYFYKQK